MSSPHKIGGSYNPVAMIKTSTSKEAELFDDRPDRDWLNPISMSKLQAAVKRRAETVVLNGHEFSIEYGIVWKSHLAENYEVVRLRRTDGALAPFGYVSMNTIRKFKFEGHQRR